MEGIRRRGYVGKGRGFRKNKKPEIARGSGLKLKV